MKNYKKLSETGKPMATTLRLKDAEQEKVRKKCIEINKILVREGHEPLKDSEFIHIVLDKAIEMAEVNKTGQVILKEG